MQGCDFRLAADIGGTFTDIACLSRDGALTTAKVPSTPDDYARGVMNGLKLVMGDLGIDGARVAEILHASTIATNAILEAKGAVTALVTTAGFRDVLELRRIRVPRLYEPLYEKPAPLVPRRRRFELAERMGPRGEVLTPLDMDEVRRLAGTLAIPTEAGPIAAIAICFLHAFTNPAHEEAVAACLRQELPGVFISASCEVLPEIREYERTSTTVINAYIGPPVRDYLQSLLRSLAAAGITGRLLMMQSSGGTLDVERILRLPASVVESGPAAGVIGAARLGAATGNRDLITLDMGGTTAKASLIENGALSRTDDYEVGGGISLSSRLAKGGGYAVKLPVIDISEVGAGGGSIVWLDEAGALKVGPQSAGASPGPACYGAGGDQPTVTDANVVLGYLNQTALAGGTVGIDAARARAVLDEKIAKPLGLDLFDAAYGVHVLANARMMRAVKTVSTFRGRDPRDFTLFAFGGNGGIHAAELARELQMTTILVPPASGVFSAVGLLFADFEFSLSRAFLKPISAASPDIVTGLFNELETRVLAELGAAPRAKLQWRADLRYGGQASELSIPVARCRPGEMLDVAAIAEAFELDHELVYGHRSAAGAIVEFVVLRVTGTIPPEAALDPRAISFRPTPTIVRTTRPVYFGPGRGLHTTDVIGRFDVTETPMPGPLVIEEYEGTTIVPPGAKISRDRSGMMRIVLEA